MWGLSTTSTTTTTSTSTAVSLPNGADGDSDSVDWVLLPRYVRIAHDPAAKVQGPATNSALLGACVFLIVGASGTFLQSLSPQQRYRGPPTIAGRTALARFRARLQSFNWVERQQTVQTLAHGLLLDDHYDDLTTTTTT